MALLLRRDKGIYLTSDEVDNNFVFLNTQINTLTGAGTIAEKLDKAALLSTLLTVSGNYSGLNTTYLQSMLPNTLNVGSTVVVRDASGNFAGNNITAASFLGNASSATLAAGLSTTLPFNQGGTGVTALAVGFISSNGTILISSPVVLGSYVSGDIAGNSQSINGILPVTHGGTGANTPYAAQIALQLVPGVNVQPYYSALTALAIIPSNGFVYKNSGTYSARTIRVTGGLTIVNGDGSTGDPTISLQIPLPLMWGGTGGIDQPSARVALGVPQIMIFSIINSAQSIFVYNHYGVSTSGGAITLTLPLASSVLVGDSLKIKDIDHTFATHNLIIAGNGSLIESAAGNLICDQSGTAFELLYSGASRGWIIV